MSQNNVSERDRAYQHMIKNLKPNLRQYPLDPREAIETYHNRVGANRAPRN